MIKALTRYDYTKKALVVSGRIAAKSRLKTRWYTLNSTQFGWFWDNPLEPLLAPTCLSAWSK
ncbi:hypothetical protein EKK58_08300 [Candidatus Dependentiae bacterium]|nr:MAG: hypothetical protein EKK58_08300 [Candidatus Dependentiae bacterium]